MLAGIKIDDIKLSKYTYSFFNDYGDLIMYNFLTGPRSLSRINKSEVDLFNRLISGEDKGEIFEKNKESVYRLLDLGVLVRKDVEENLLHEAIQYERIYENDLILTILPTWKCNFNCPYCYERAKNVQDYAMNEKSQCALIRFVQKQIGNYKKLRVCWFGGEPLLETEIIDRLSTKFLQICKTRYIPYSAEIITNGYSLNKDTFKHLYNLKVYNYKITLDGFGKQHNQTRHLINGDGSFEKIINNLLEIRDCVECRHAHICIRVNITRHLVDDLDDFIQFLYVSFGDDSRFSFQFVPVKSFIQSDYLEEKIVVDSDDLAKKLMNNPIYKDKLRPDIEWYSNIISDIGCVANRKNTYVISPDLNIYKCCVHFDMDNNYLGKIDLAGNLHINNDIHRRWFLLNNYIQKIPEKCNECFYFPACYYGGRECPVYYLNSKQEKMECLMEKEDFPNYLVNTITRLSEKSGITTIYLKS